MISSLKVINCIHFSSLASTWCRNHYFLWGLIYILVRKIVSRLIARFHVSRFQVLGNCSAMPPKFHHRFFLLGLNAPCDRNFTSKYHFWIFYTVGIFPWPVGTLIRLTQKAMVGLMVIVLPTGYMPCLISSCHWHHVQFARKMFYGAWPRSISRLLCHWRRGIFAWWKS